jgi:energy-coupling factor transport system permease protein
MHPSLRILALVLLAVVIQTLGMLPLIMAGVALLLPTALLYGNLLRHMLKRSRWLFVAVLLVFALGTPGEYPVWWEWAMAPTYEGLELGIQQAVRLLIMLTALALLMGTTPRADLMAGIFPLLSPLRYLGMSPERFTARLWLTLHYVEEEPLRIREMAWGTLGQVGTSGSTDRVCLDIPDFSFLDKAIVLGMTLLVIWWAA